MLTAFLYDGKAAAAQVVQLSLIEPQGLDNGEVGNENLAKNTKKLFIIKNNTLLCAVDLKEVQWLEPLGNAPRRASLPNAMQLRSDNILAWDTWLKQQNIKNGSWISKIQTQLKWALPATVICIALVTVFIVWGIPTLSPYIANALPRTFDDEVGEQAWEYLSPRFEESKLPLEIQEKYQKKYAQVIEVYKEYIAKNNIKSLERYPIPEYQLLFRKAPDIIGPNAFALPNGTLVITDQLIELVKRDEDVIMGVLGHELGHVRYRHGMRLLVQNTLLGAVAALVLNDISTVMAGVPVLLGQASYSRGAEQQADVEAAHLLTANNINPVAMVKFFKAIRDYTKQEKIGKDKGQNNRACNDNNGCIDSTEHTLEQGLSTLGIALSSHPADNERVLYFETFAKEAGFSIDKVNQSKNKQ